MRRTPPRFAFQPPQPTWFLTKLKADWACGLQQLRKVQRRANHVAEIAIKAGKPHVANDDDAVYVESPTTVNNHYHPRRSMGGLLVALLVLIALLLGLALGAWLIPPRSPVTTPAPAPGPAAGNAYDVSIYEP